MGEGAGHERRAQSPAPEDDEQSLRGKVAQGVLNAAREGGVQAIVLCGERRIDQPGTRAFSIAERFGLEPALERPAQLLEELAAEVAKEMARG